MKTLTATLLLLHLLQGILAQGCAVDGDIRLVGGRDGGEGRLELCRNGEWGTVCNEGWDLTDARVACTQLDPAVDLQGVVTDLYFPGGASAQVVHLMDVDCAGNETRLVDCTSVPADVGACDTTRAVGLVCSVSQSECNSGDVRLVGGPSSDEGRVQYCAGGRWGTVCENDGMFDLDEAAVICRQQGFLAGPSMIGILGNTFFSPLPPLGDEATVPIVLSNLACSGTENNLSECGHAPSISSCSHPDDVAVYCGCPNNYELRLVQGVGRNNGRLEFCLDGRWRILCTNGVNLPDVTVMCRQLGFDPIIVELLPVEDFSLLPLIDRGGTLTLMYEFEFQCTGNESRLEDCVQVPLDTCGVAGIGISCPVDIVPECEFGDIRLQDGLLSNQIGRVEVCANGRWGLVCRNQWDVMDTTVACRQLGYEGTGLPVEYPLRFGNELERGFLLDNLECVGDEENLLGCPHPGLTVLDCMLPFDDVGVICGTTAERCPGGSLNISESDVIVPDENQPVTVVGYGTCEKYQSQSESESLCDSFIDSNSYVFMNESGMSQSNIRSALGVVGLIITIADENCRDQIVRAVCTYFYPPCGSQDGVHLPLALCSEECESVRRSCPDNTWDVVMVALSDNLGVVDCSTTSSRFGGFSACCIGAGITIPPPVTTNPLTEPSQPPSEPLQPSSSDIEDLVAPLAGGIIAAIFVIVVVLVVIVICLFMTNVKRKKIVKEIQMEVLTNPTSTLATVRTEMSPPPTQDLELSTSPGGKAMSLSPTPSPTFKMRNGSSKKVVPNAYSSLFTPEKELDFSAPLLNPLSGKSSNRISSSMIRELSSDMVIPYCRLNLLDCIGQGEFGVVYKAEYHQPTIDNDFDITTVAVKTLKGFFDRGKVDSIMDESLKMKHFDHPNVLGLIGVCLDAGPAPYVVMPYMANGSLLHYLKKERRDIVLSPEVDDDVKVDIRKRLTIMCLQIANGMDYLAEEKFVHRDLAARNCMIDLHFVIKISDFGLSEDVYSKNYFRQCDNDSSVKLPVKWMAPESLNDGVFSEKTDVWSFGVTCWEVFSGGKTPYPGVDPLQLSSMLEQNKRLNKPVNSACSDEIYKLLMNCWCDDPEDRSSFSQIAKTLSGYIETLAGYLDMNFNPFVPTPEQKPLENGFNNDVLTHPEQLAALYDNIPRVKAKSPRGSPRVSPLPSPSHTNKSLLSGPSTNIKIQIDSPPPSHF